MRHLALSLGLICGLACDGSAGPTNRLDLLFVIDDSGSTREEQLALGAALPTLLQRLEDRPGGLPDLHVGVVNSDMGAGPTPFNPTCLPLGDRGVFQARAGCGLDTRDGNYLRIAPGRPPSFSGPLATTLACLVELGVFGCGYEHHLQSMRAALAQPAAHPENQGFLRTDALLAVVILADEDDCSGEPTATLYQDQIPGQGFSLRCATLGHVCQGQPVPAQDGFRAPLASCEPYQRQPEERDTRLIPVPEYVAFLNGLKPERPQRLFVGAIIGWDDSPDAEYRIDRASHTDELQLRGACFSNLGMGAPGIRLRAFARAFPHHAVHSVCGPDFTPALDEMGRKLAALLK